jgi:hypothetical protein
MVISCGEICSCVPDPVGNSHLDTGRIQRAGQILDSSHKHVTGGEYMLFVLWFKWEPENTTKVEKLWREFKFPKEVKVIGRYLLIGRHMSVAIFDAPSEEMVLKITYPFRELGIAHVNPALPLEESLKMMDRM